LRSPFYREAVGMAQVYTVTASTSIVLVNSIVAPNTIVLLSSIQYPGHIIGVRDTTGSNEIANFPIIISTMEGLNFYDGTSSILINQPNGYLSFSSRDRSTWQLLNSFGFLTTLSTGFVETLTAQRAFVTTLSSIEGFISSMTVANVFISKSFEVLGNTEIGGDIAIGGSLNVFSTLHAFESMNLSSGLTVGGTTSFPSTLFVRDDFTVGSNLSTLQNLIVGQDLTIDTSLYAEWANLPLNLSVQTLDLNTLQLGGGFQLAGGISTTNLSTVSSLYVLGKGTFENAISVSAMTAVFNSVTIDGELLAVSTVVNGEVSVFQDVRAASLAVSGGFSTLQTVTNQTTVFAKDGLIYGPVSVTDVTELDTLDVQGTAFLSSLRVSTLNMNGYLSSYGSTFTVESDLDIRGALVIGEDLFAGFRGLPFTSAFFSTASFLSSVSIESTLTISTLLSVEQDGWILGDINSVQSLTVGSNVSTYSLDISGNLTVYQNLNVDQIVSVGTLGAPIRLDISTLVLSNTLTVDDASIPVLTTDFFTGTIAVGGDLTNVGSNTLYVDGILQNSGSVSQGQKLGLWTANTLQASTVQGNNTISSSVIGPTTFDYPIGEPLSGSILTGGVPLDAGAASIYFANNITSQFYATKPITSLTGFTPRRIRFNGSNAWVAVGEERGGSGINAMYSSDGYNWTQSSGLSPSMALYDVAYGNGRWVTTGSNGFPNILYSDNDGVSWTAGTNTFTVGGFGRGVAYNGSRWVAVGQENGNATAKYSDDGIAWTNATVQFFNAGPMRTVLWDGFFWRASQYPTRMYRSLDAVFWSLATTGSLYQLDIDYMAVGPAPPGFFTPLGLIYTFVSVISNANPLTTISFGVDGGGPQPLELTGIFTGAGTDIFYDSNTSLWYVSGYGENGVGPNLAVSADLTTWTPYQSFEGSNLTLAAGTIQGPVLGSFFTANVTSIFHSTLSSQTIVASTINASSFQGSFFGDGSLLTNITKFSDNFFVSSMIVSTIQTNEIETDILRMNATTDIMDRLEVTKSRFFSSGNIYLAAGTDYVANGSIQISQEGSTWTKAFTSSFNTYGNAVTGTSNLSNPFYVAVGADTRERYTIQYSQTGFDWTPVDNGGFSYESEEGFREAKDVAYDSNTNTWVAVGVDIGGSNTIQYSLDGINWNTAINGFQNYGIKVIANPYPNVIFSRFLGLGSNGIKRSPNGFEWFDCITTTFSSNVTTTFTAIAPGKLYSFPFFTGWLAVDVENRIFITINEDATGFIHDEQQGDNWKTKAPVKDVLWLGSDANWIAIGSNALQRSQGGFVWTLSNTLNADELNSIVFNSTLQTYVIGATATNQSNTIFMSSDLDTWAPANQGSGFSTIVANYGQGYGVTTLGTSTFAVGNSALSIQGRVRPSILNIDSANGGYSTIVSLTASNASNLFVNAVRGIGATSNEINQYVAVGDARIPQKTIARSPDGSPGSWIPAITGGFSTTGYGVTYFGGNWFAVGDAQITGNTIQYSADGANWFGTNNSSGIRSGGRGITEANLYGCNYLVAVGKDTGTNTIVYTTDLFGFQWAAAPGFNVQGNGVASGAGYVVAVGEDTNLQFGLRLNTILISQNLVAFSWSIPFTLIEFFGPLGGFGITYSPSLNRFVAVGDKNPNGVTILYSGVGDPYSWNQDTVDTFTGIGYGVTWNSNDNLFFAVGQDANGDAPPTIKYSGDAVFWSNVEVGSGFLSQKKLGSANGLFTQPTASTETVPYMNFSNLAIYERNTPLFYPYPTIRLSTNYVTLMEGLTVRSSVQVCVGLNETFGPSALTVSPFPTYVSHLVYSGEPYISSFAFFSTLQVSSVTTGPNGANIQSANPIVTPSFALNIPSSFNEVPAPSIVPTNYTHTKANDIYPVINALTTDLFVNDTLQVSSRNVNLLPLGVDPSLSYLYLGEKPVNTSLFTGGIEVNVQGNFATSSLSTSYLYTSNVFVSTSGIYFQDQYLTLYEGLPKPTGYEGFSIETTPSSITFETSLTLQVSTQKIGLFTSNPKFELDVQTNAMFYQTLKTAKTNTSLLFLQFQTF
jgi:hypothetical protein